MNELMNERMNATTFMTDNIHIVYRYLYRSEFYQDIPDDLSNVHHPATIIRQITTKVRYPSVLNLPYDLVIYDPSINSI